MPRRGSSQACEYDQNTALRSQFSLSAGNAVRQRSGAALIGEKYLGRFRQESIIGARRQTLRTGTAATGEVFSSPCSGRMGGGRRRRGSSLRKAGCEALGSPWSCGRVCCSGRSLGGDCRDQIFRLGCDDRIRGTTQCKTPSKADLGLYRLATRAWQGCLTGSDLPEAPRKRKQAGACRNAL